MNGKFLRDSRPRLCDRRFLRDAPPIDYVGILNGTTKPTINFNFQLDPDTTQVIYIATGVLSGALLLSAFISRIK